MNVLLASDGSPSARDAEQLVAAVPWPPDTRVTILNVEEMIAGDWSVPPDRFFTLRQEMQRRLDARIGEVQAALTSRGHQSEVVRVSGDPGDVIVREARRLESDLVVVGSRGHGGLASAVLGSVAASVVDNAPCPVLVARTPTLTRVVLAHDGSDGSREAEELVTTAPYLAALPITVVSAYGYVPYYLMSDVGSGMPIDPTLYQQIVEDERTESTLVAGAAADRLSRAGRDVSKVVREGYASQVIIDAASATRADLIVIGSRGNTGLVRLVVGSVARSVLFHAHCSVLIVRPAVARVTERREGATAVSA